MGAVYAKGSSMKKWILAAVLAVQAAWGADGARMVFDRGGGFTAGAGEEVRIGARVEGGGGFGISRWEGNAPGRAEGRRKETFAVDTSEPGEYWLRAAGWCDGTDAEVRGTIRFRVEGGASAEARGRREGETMVWSEDFSSLSGGSEMTSWKGWTGSKMFNGTNCLKVGSGKASGEAVSPIVEMPGASGRAEFSLRGFGSDGTTVRFSGCVDGGEWSEWGAYSNLASEAETHSVPIPSCRSVQLKWTGRGKRFHLDDVAVYKTEAPIEPSAPALDLDPGDTAVELIPGQSYSLTATATEFDGDVITLAASGLPDGAEWETAGTGTGSLDGRFAWTPSVTGTWAVAFSATDKDGTTEKTVAFTVAPEGAGKLGFASDAVNVREDAGSVTLTVVRTGGAKGTVGAWWSTQDGTATTGFEYGGGSGTLEFADGQTSANVTVTLCDDSEVAGNKRFTVSIGRLAGGAAYGANPICTVTILDDDDPTAEYYAGCYENGVLMTGADLKAALCAILNTGVRNHEYSEVGSILAVVDKPEGDSQVRCIYSQTGTGFYNKEHIWAQSHGIDTVVPGYSDVHHIRACIQTLNDMRADKDFDNCRGVSGAESSSGCYSTSDAFEPPDAAKGDVARACFYMAVRYQGKYNANANLELVDFVGTTSDGNQLGKLSTLLAWNELDPPDDFERRRNELIYTSYQHNRNPFIDHPTWVRAVFDPAHFEGESVVWTVSVVTSGKGMVDDRSGVFPAGATNGLAKTFSVRPTQYWHIGSIAWDRVAQGFATNAAGECDYVTPTVTNNARLDVVFAEDTAVLGTPTWWLAQHGYSGDWDAAELADWNGDGVPNWQEYKNGTDTRLRITGIELLGSEVRLSFNREASAVCGTDDLTGEWMPLPEADCQLDGTNATITIPPEKAKLFLRAEP
jgi:endonuclease I